MVLKYYKINIQIETSWNRIIVKKSFLRVLRLKSKFMVFISFIIHKTEVISRQTYTITRFYDSKKGYKYTRRQWYLFINPIISFPYFLWQYTYFPFLLVNVCILLWPQIHVTQGVRKWDTELMKSYCIKDRMSKFKTFSISWDILNAYR